MLLFAVAGGSYFLLPKIVVLGDVAYEWGDWAYTKNSARWELLKMGYRLEYRSETALPTNAMQLETLLQTLDVQDSIVVATPLVSLALLRAAGDQSEVLSPIVGMGKGALQGGKFRSSILFDTKEGWKAAAQYLKGQPLATAVIEDTNALLPHGNFSTFNKLDGESDQLFATRTLRSMQEQSVLNVASPDLGFWSVSMAKESTLMWALDAKDSPLVDKEHLNGVVADDLATALPLLLRQLKAGSVDSEIRVARSWFPVKGRFGNFFRFGR